MIADNIHAAFTARWATETASGQLCVERCHAIIEANGLATVIEMLATVAERVYSQLPSGDYGRGDVNRVLAAAIYEAQDLDAACKNDAANYWQGADCHG